LVDQEFDLWGDPIPPRGERRGRPKHVPTDEKRNRVKVLKALNKTDTEVAEAMGLSEPTLRKYYLRELRGGMAQLRAEAAVKLWDLAKGGNVSALKAFLAEARHSDLLGQPASKRRGRETPAQTMGKKDAAQLAAETADEGTGWAGLLRH
jgi:hypothetical protein